MSILWQDGFDLYATASDLDLNYTIAFGTVQTTGGRFAGGSWQLNPNNPGTTKSFASMSDVWLSYAFTVYSNNTGDRLVATFGSPASPSGGIEVCITYNYTTGVWKAWRGYMVTLLGSVTFPVNAGWHWLDSRCKYDASSGIVELWIDENQIINLTGQNTEQNSSTGIVYACVGDSSGNGVTGPFQIDDMFITDGTTGRLGDSRIETVVPTSDQSPNNGTPSTGTNHYAVVDEPQYNTSDYITMPNTSGDKEVFGHGPISASPTNVYSVKVYLISEKSNAGSFQVQPLVISSATEADGTAQQLTTSWGVQASTFEVDPATSAPWTYAAANAAKVGFKVP